MRFFRSFCIAILACAGEPALAQDDAVVITALRNPVAKSYRKMVQGMEHFERKRHLAPEASLRFRLLPRKPGTRMDDINLQVAADTAAIPLRVAADRTFELERDEALLRKDARVMPDRRAGTMTWRADVRSPGLPPDTRRLGDLRLECEVGMKAGLISDYPPSFFGWLDELFPQGPAYCRREVPRYLFFADRPLFGVTLVHGERREALSVDRLYAGATRNAEWKKKLRHCDCEALIDRAYFVPLGDASWPDDTLVVLEPM